MTAPTPLPPEGEFGRIERILEVARWSSLPGEVIVPPGDDAVVLRMQDGESIVLSSDLSVEGVHFDRAWMDWEVIGYRAAASALSDLAAMAARPVGILLSAALPPELGQEVCEQIAVGVRDALRSSEAALLGGDLTSSPGPVCIDVTVIGGAREAVTRSGAAAGDELWVTGSLGGAASALSALRAGLEPDHEARRRFEHPPVRWREARWLAERGALTSVIDLSDGLAGDARHLARASGVALRIDAGVVPLHASLSGWNAEDVALAMAVGGGEDYELLFTAPPGSMDELVGQWAATFDARVTRIGDVAEVAEGGRLTWIDEAGEPMDPPASSGYDHFAG